MHLTLLYTIDRYADKLAKVWRKSGEEEWVLAHLEVQGQPETVFDQRMYS